MSQWKSALTGKRVIRGDTNAVLSVIMTMIMTMKMVRYQYVRIRRKLTKQYGCLELNFEKFQVDFY